ncbi:uncharacterized protein [Antedon mediterranea]|uniref:uncharacterized protein n=1 Tax=Antedon mediterranea TaxID=105859 RepID=UPI003AF9A304
MIFTRGCSFKELYSRGNVVFARSERRLLLLDHNKSLHEWDKTLYGVKLVSANDNNMDVIIIYLAVLISLFCDFIHGMQFIEQPTGVTVGEGESFILRCVIGDKGTDNIFWKTMDSSTILSTDTVIDPDNELSADKQRRYSIVGNHYAGEYNLKIENATREDAGRYSCLYFTKYIRYSHVANVRIMLPPSEGYPKCSVHPHGAVAGDTVRLTCRSSGGDPPASLAWVYGNSILKMLLPSNPDPVNEVSYTLKDDDLNKVFTCAATTPAIQQALSCSILPYRKKIFVFVQPVFNNVMAGEYANFQCSSPKRSGTIRWVIGSTPVDPSDSKYTITRKGKRLKILKTNRREHNDAVISCLIMDRFGLAGNGSAVLMVHSWETTTPFVTTEELATEIMESDVGVTEKPSDTVLTNIPTSVVPLITERSFILDKSAIRHAKKNPSSTVTTQTVTRTPLVPTVTKATESIVTKARLEPTTREVSTAQRSIDVLEPHAIKDFRNAQGGNENNNKGTNITTQSVQTMTTSKQIDLTTESVQSTQLMSKSTFDTLSSASSNVQTTRLMSSATVSMEIKTDADTQSTMKNIVQNLSDRGDLSNDIVTRSTQTNDMVSLILNSNDISINNYVTKNHTEFDNNSVSQQAKSKNGDDSTNELFGKSMTVLIGGLVGLVTTIIIVIVLIVVYTTKRRRDTTEIKAV